MNSQAFTGSTVKKDKPLKYISDIVLRSKPREETRNLMASATIEKTKKKKKENTVHYPKRIILFQVSVLLWLNLFVQTI